MRVPAQTDQESISQSFSLLTKTKQDPPSYCHRRFDLYARLTSNCLSKKLLSQSILPWQPQISHFKHVLEESNHFGKMQLLKILNITPSSKQFIILTGPSCCRICHCQNRNPIKESWLKYQAWGWDQSITEVPPCQTALKEDGLLKAQAQSLDCQHPNKHFRPGTYGLQFYAICKDLDMLPHSFGGNPTVHCLLMPPSGQFSWLPKPSLCNHY